MFSRRLGPHKIELGLLKSLKNYQNRHLIVAVSGGVDSVALLFALKSVSGPLNFELSVAHVHHGPGEPKQMKFRDSARAQVRSLARQLKLPFESNRPRRKGLVLRSELELREFRLKALEKMRRAKGEGTVLVLGHNKDDLLETRVMRLIRGVAQDGIVGMTEAQGVILRPFLGYSRLEILDYARRREIQWWEDPSNQSCDPLRNWLRNNWLAQLERRLPGAKASLARSLENLAAQSVNEVRKSQGSFLPRSDLLGMNETSRRSAVASYIKNLGVKNFGSSHINEVLKHLDRSQKNHKFYMLKHLWVVSPQRLKAKPAVGPKSRQI